MLQQGITAFDLDTSNAADGKGEQVTTSTDGKNGKSNKIVSKSEIDLPTPALYMETSVGACEGLEPFLIDHRNIDRDPALVELGLQKEKLEHRRQETARLKARLAKNPPMLEDPRHDDDDPHP